MSREFKENGLRLAACGLRRSSGLDVDAISRARRRAQGASRAFRGRGFRGFTLIEVLVVISILVILASVTLIAVNKARQTARATSTQSFMNSVNTALNAFERDHGFYPPSFIDSVAYPNSPMRDWRGAEILAQSLLGYLPKDTNTPPDPKIQDGVDGPGAKKLEQRNYQYATSGRNLGPYIESRSNDSLVETNRNAGDGDPGNDLPYDPRRFYFTTASSSYNAPLLYIRKERGNPPSAGVEPPLWDVGADPTLTARDGQYQLAHNADPGSSDIFDTSTSPLNEILPGIPMRPHGLFEYWEATDAQGGPGAERKQSFERTLRSAKYMLASPGLNEQFGIAGNNGTVEAPTSEFDDIAYDDLITTGP